MRKSILFTVLLMVAVLISACSDSGDDNNTPPAQTYDITGKIDYAGKTISSAKVCLDVNNNGLADDTACADTDNSGEYYFTSDNNPAYYPLAAFIKETSGSAAVSAKIAVESNEYDSILYAPRGKTDNISITTTLAKSLMDKDSTLTFDNAEKTADTIIKKADSSATVLTVYNNALNTAPNSIDISTSIRGLVSVITDKLSNEVEITNSTAITVTQEEVNTANDEIKKADKEQPQEPTALTPVERIYAILDSAKEMPLIDLTEYSMTYYEDGKNIQGMYDSGLPTLIIRNLDKSLFLNPVLNLDMVLYDLKYPDKKYDGSYDFSEKLFYIRNIKPCSGIIEDTYITYNDSSIVQAMKNNADCMMGLNNPDLNNPSVLNAMANCLETFKGAVKAKYKVDTNKLTNYSCN